MTKKEISEAIDAIDDYRSHDMPLDDVHTNGSVDHIIKKLFPDLKKGLLEVQYHSHKEDVTYSDLAKKFKKFAEEVTKKQYDIGNLSKITQKDLVKILFKYQ